MIILMIMGAVIFSLVTFFVFKKSKSFSGTKKTLSVILSFVIFALGLEVTIFNVNFYNTRGNEEISLNQYMDYHKDGNENFILTYENSTLFFPEIDEKIENIYFDILSTPYKNIPVKIKLSDEANIVTYETPERLISATVKKSHYINIHASGVVSGLTVDFNLDENDVIVLKGVYLNTERPFSFSIIRILIVFAFLGFCYLFSSKSELYTKKFTNNK